MGELLLGARNLFLRLVGSEGGRATDGDDHGGGAMCLWAACWEAREGKVGAGEKDLGPGVLVVALKLSDGALRWLESSPVGSCHGCVWEERGDVESLKKMRKM